MTIDEIINKALYIDKNVILPLLGAGLYILCDPATKSVVYVGQSRFLLGRVGNYDLRNLNLFVCPTGPRDYTGSQYHPGEPVRTAERLDLERQLIEVLNPRDNILGKKK